MREIIELLSFLNDAHVDVDLLQESSSRSRKVEDRETPFWRVVMPLMITAVLLTGAFAIIAWMLWHTGLLGQLGPP